MSNLDEGIRWSRLAIVLAIPVIPIYIFLLFYWMPEELVVVEAGRDENGNALAR